MGNLANYIEAYIKKMLLESHSGVLETQRSDLAEKFNCVPSQINYVLSTRFSMDKGYLVETRRGGGGYIRILKITLDPHNDLQKILNNSIGQSIDFNNAVGIVQRFVDEGWLTIREGKILVSIIDPSVLRVTGEVADALRAAIVKSALLKALS